MLKLRHYKIHCEIALSPSVIKRALKISFIVGSILNLINQGNYIFSLDFANIHILKLLLTYIVPYSVTTYTATAMKIEFHIGTKASVEADLKCRVCKNEIHVQKEELIQECPKCGINTHWKLK